MIMFDIRFFCGLLCRWSLPKHATLDICQMMNEASILQHLWFVKCNTTPSLLEYNTHLDAAFK